VSPCHPAVVSVRYCVAVAIIRVAHRFSLSDFAIFVLYLCILVVLL